MINSLMTCVRVAGYQPALAQAEQLAKSVFEEHPAFTPDNTFRHGGHNYAELGERKAGEKLEVTYPVPVREEEASVGNPGFPQYRYRVTWKGDTVVRMAPLGDMPATAYSDFDKKQVPVFYGTEGPGPFYQRDYMLKDGDLKPAALQMDDGTLDFWLLR